MQAWRTLPLGQKGAKKFLSDPIRWIYLFLRNCHTDGRSLINILDPVSE